MRQTTFLSLMKEILVYFIRKIYIFILFYITIINKNYKKKKNKGTSLAPPHKSLLIGIMICFLYNFNFIFIF